MNSATASGRGIQSLKAQTCADPKMPRDHWGLRPTLAATGPERGAAEMTPPKETQAKAQIPGLGLKDNSRKRIFPLGQCQPRVPFSKQFCSLQKGLRVSKWLLLLLGEKEWERRKQGEGRGEEERAHISLRAPCHLGRRLPNSAFHSASASSTPI